MNDFAKDIPYNLGLSISNFNEVPQNGIPAQLIKWKQQWFSGKMAGAQGVIPDRWKFYFREIFFYSHINVMKQQFHPIRNVWVWWFLCCFSNADQIIDSLVNIYAFPLYNINVMYLLFIRTIFFTWAHMVIYTYNYPSEVFRSRTRQYLWRANWHQLPNSPLARLARAVAIASRKVFNVISPTNCARFR